MFKSGVHIIKDIDTSKREVTFAFSKFDYDSDNDLTYPTAFDKTIAESGPEGSNRIRHVWNHDRKNYPIGALQKMWRDNDYAYATSKILTNPDAVAVMEAYQEKAINEHSYWGKSYNHGVNERGGKVLKEIKLFEVSTVLWGAQENAKLLGLIKSGDKPEPAIIEHLKSLRAWVKKSNATDDFLETLEIELMKAEDILESLEKSGHDSIPDPVEPKIELSLADIWKLKNL